MPDKMIFNQIFLDTAYIIALLNQNDSYHEAAKRLFAQVRTAREVWITEAVLIEVGNALSCLNRTLVVDFINSCYSTPNIKVVGVDRKLFLQAVEFYHKRKDKEWGLTDCISFVVMNDAGLTDALTTDEHFQQAGFRAVLL